MPASEKSNILAFAATGAHDRSGGASLRCTAGGRQQKRPAQRAAVAGNRT
jgi:hypothetical protein